MLRSSAFKPRVNAQMWMPRNTARVLCGAPFVSVSAATQQRLCTSGNVAEDLMHFREKKALKQAASATTKPAEPGVNPLDKQTATNQLPAGMVWSAEELKGVQQTHRPTRELVDTIALSAIRCVRYLFDVASGYSRGQITTIKVLRRVVLLETVAGVPGMMAGTLRHLRSLRRVERDHAWIESLFEEAENERTHMLVFVQLYNPGIVLRGLVFCGQLVFWNVFFLLYLASPKFCHRFVGYLEEEAVRTYTHVIHAMEGTAEDQHRVAPDLVAFGKSPAKELAIRYWKMPAQSTMLDVMYAVRADEANHRDCNHGFADLKRDQPNPYIHATKYEQDIDK